MIRFHIKELIADKEFNENRRVTMEEISEKTGIHRTTLSKIANIKGYNATTDVINQLCAFFGVNIDKIATYIPEDEG